MKILIFGAAGNVGRRLVSEAVSRGHEVTAVMRSSTWGTDFPEKVITKVGDISNSRDVRKLSRDQETVINATRPRDGQEQEIDQTTLGLIEGLAGAKTRLLIVGGAASLVVPGTNGKTVLEDPKYLDPAYRNIGRASLRQYQLIKSVTDIDWAYLCPPADLFPGTRMGFYRMGKDELLIDNWGQSKISMEDYAAAMIDEAEEPIHFQERFTVAY